MEGFVMLVNGQEKMAAIKIEDGSYSVLKLLGESNVQTGDHLKGQLQVIGEQDILNQSTGQSLHVQVQHAHGIVAAKTKHMLGMIRS